MARILPPRSAIATPPIPAPILPKTLRIADRNELSRTPMTVIEGALPKDLYGHYFVVGPCGNEATGGLPYNESNATSTFSGDGLIARFDFEVNTDGDCTGVAVSTRIAGTPDFYADKATTFNAKLSHLGFQNHGMIRFSWRLGARDLLNTAFLPMGSEDPAELPRLLVTYDAGRPWEIDLETLDLVTAVGWSDEWQAEALRFQPFATVFSTAHPVWDQQTSEFFSVNYGKGMEQLAGMLPMVAREMEAVKELKYRAKCLLDDLNPGGEIQRLYTDFNNWMGRTQTNLSMMLPDALHGILPESFIFLLRWDGKANFTRWLLVDEKGAKMVIPETVHQMVATRDYLVLMDTSFKVGMGQVFSNPFPQFTIVERMFRSFWGRRIRNDVTFYIIKRADLIAKPGQAPLKTNEDVTLTVKEVTVPMPAVHFTADYENPNGHINLQVVHTTSQDLAEWIRPYDTSAYSKKNVSMDLLGLIPSAVDLTRLGRYVLDGETAQVVGSGILAGDPNTWSLTLATGAGQCMPGRLQGHNMYAYWGSGGMWNQLMTQYIFNMYANDRNRLVPLEQLKALQAQGDRPATLFCVVCDTLAVIDSYTAPPGVMIFSNQFMPRRGGDPTDEQDGYIVCMAYTNEQVEVWLFEATNLAKGPICKLACPKLIVGVLLHTAWLPRIGRRTASYIVPVQQDYGPRVKRRSASVQELFDTYVYPHFPDPPPPPATSTAVPAVPTITGAD